MIKIFINNEEVMFNQNLQISEEILVTSSIILDNCYPKKWEIDKDYVSRFYYPKDYSRCEIYDDDQLIFCGCVKNTGSISLNPRYPKTCKLQVLDYKTFLSEGTTLDFVISNKTVEEAIMQVTSAISSYGFVVGNIVLKSSNDLIGAYSTLDKTAYDVYQYLSEITNSKWYTRRIDENQIAIDFYDSDQLPKASDIDYTNDFWEKNKIVDMSYSYSSSDYRNKQIISSSKVYASIESKETKIANGYNKDFSTDQSIGIISSILVNGQEKSFATNSEKEIGIIADFYYNPGEMKFSANDTFSSGTEIVISYIALVQGREIAYNTSEIRRIKDQLGINGVISRYENRNDVLYSSQLQMIAKNYIKYKGSAEITLKITTYNSNLFFVGQQVFFNAPITDLKTDYMVKKKTTSIYYDGQNMNAFYDFELTSSFNSESAINYFDNQRSKNNGNISEGQYISRNIDVVTSTDLVFSDLEIKEVQVENDNVLNAIINSPFVK